MKSTAWLFRCSLFFLVLSVAGKGSMFVANASDHPSGGVSASDSPQQARDVSGTWSGTFQSRQPSFAPFTMTVMIHRDQSGVLVGKTSVSADCMKDGTVRATVNGANVVLAGGDEEGNHITFEGSFDQSGTVLNLKYVLNSSASARCESDDGTGTMVKR